MQCHHASPGLLRCCLFAPAVLLGNHKPVPGGPSRCSLCPLTGQLELLSDVPAKADKRRLPGMEQSCIELVLSMLSAALHMLLVVVCQESMHALARLPFLSHFVVSVMHLC